LQMQKEIPVGEGVHITHSKMKYVLFQESKCFGHIAFADHITKLH
jgi:hypothetical protein